MNYCSLGKTALNKIFKKVVGIKNGGERDEAITNFVEMFGSMSPRQKIDFRKKQKEL